jgi:hypothetical protein
LGFWWLDAAFSWLGAAFSWLWQGKEGRWNGSIKKFKDGRNCHCFCLQSWPCFVFHGVCLRQRKCRVTKVQRQDKTNTTHTNTKTKTKPDKAKRDKGKTRQKRILLKPVNQGKMKPQSAPSARMSMSQGQRPHTHSGHRSPRRAYGHSSSSGDASLYKRLANQIATQERLGSHLPPREPSTLPFAPTHHGAAMSMTWEGRATLQLHQTPPEATLPNPRPPFKESGSPHASPRRSGASQDLM